MVASVQDKFVNQCKIWKGQQLVAEVLRFQIQQEAVRDAYKARENMRNAPSSGSYMSLAPNDAHELSTVDFTVKRVIAQGVPRDQYSTDQMQFIRLTFGTWSVRMSSSTPKRNGMRWENLDLRVNILTNSVYYDQLLVESFDESALQADILISSGYVPISNTLGSNIGRDIEICVKLKDKDGNEGGEVLLIVHTDHSKPLPQRAFDPKDLLHEEMNISQSKIKFVNGSSHHKGREDDLSGVYPSLVDEQSNFTKLVSDLRGDGDNYVKLLLGDVDQKEILRLGHRPSKDYVKVIIITSFLSFLRHN